MTDGDGKKALAPPEVLAASVQVTEGTINAPILLRFATMADEIPRWWSADRDQKLREFWRSEPLLASAIYTVMSRQAAFSWTLTGPDKAVKPAYDLLTHADLGQGWLPFTEKGSEELCTQDNGWFIEIIRPKGKGPEVAPIGIAHLDSGACTRTGDAEIPVVYRDRKGKKHALKWWQVIMMAEMPSPIQTMNGVGFCAVSRVLKAAQILRDIGTYKKEKVSSQPQRGLWFIQGVRRSVIDDALKEAAAEEANRALTRFVTPKIIASLDPGIPLNIEQLDFASLPDGFDEETTLRWYIAQLAMGFGTDYQEFAPMPGQQLGTGAQSVVMAQKARMKSSELFRKRLEFALNQWVLPQSVTFKIVVIDPEEEAGKVEIAKKRAEERHIRIESGEISVEEARQLALDSGDLLPEMMERDITDVVVVRDTEGLPDEGGAGASAKGFFRGRRQEANPERGRQRASPRQANGKLRRRPRNLAR